MVEIPDGTVLERLLRLTPKRRMTPRGRWLQRVSFAYGNAALGNDLITREMVEKVATKIYGPCPPLTTIPQGPVPPTSGGSAWYCCVCNNGECIPDRCPLREDEKS